MRYPVNKEIMDKKSVDSKLRGYKVSSLKILKQLANSPIVTTSNIGNATTYPGEALRGQLGTLSREKLVQRAGMDEDGSQRWQLNPDIDRDWLKEFLEDLRV